MALSNVSPLFEPLTVGALRLRNRVVMAPMSRYFAVDGILPAESTSYYARRAEGGVGLVITEGATPDHAAAAFRNGVPQFHGAALAKWKEVAKEVHASGSHIVAQLWHAGLERSVASSMAVAIAPSKIQAPWAPHHRAMTYSDMNMVVQAFATSARAAQDIGFDGVNIHGAHGYLIDQFFWQRTNLRNDEFGGSLDRRARLAADIITAVREKTSPDFLIMFRFSQWKVRDYEASLASDPSELAAFLAPLVHAGVDIFDASTRRFWKQEFLNDARNLAGWTHSVTGLPSMTVGSISLSSPRRLMPDMPECSPKLASENIQVLTQRLRAGEFQLAAVGRALIANPNWVEIVRRGAYEELVPYEKRMLESLH